MVRRLEALRDELNANIKALYERINQGFESMEIITIPPQTVYCRKTESDSIAEKTNLLREVALEALQNYGPAHTGQIYLQKLPLRMQRICPFLLLSRQEARVSTF